MLGKIKKLIEQNSFCKLIVSKLLYCYFIISYRYRNQGQNNFLKKHKSVLLFKGQIRFIGNDNIISLGLNSSFNNVFFEIEGNGNQIQISNNVAFYDGGHFLIEGDNCTIVIGQYSTFGSADIFLGESNTSIHIGENCMFSREIGLGTSDFHSIIDLDSNIRINVPRNVEVGNHVWVGNSAFINKGAFIGDGSIVGHRALVPGKVFENNSLIAGFPAKVIKSNIKWVREKL